MVVTVVVTVVVREGSWLVDVDVGSGLDWRPHWDYWDCHHSPPCPASSHYNNTNTDITTNTNPYITNKTTIDTHLAH